MAQELIIRSEDCGTTLGIWVEGVAPDTASRRNYLETKLYGRALLNDLTLSDGTVLEANTILGDPEVDALRRDPGIDRVRVRSVAHLRCRPRHLLALLRPLPGHRQPDRARRGRRRHRRPVDRRARHAADDADVPHRWCGRPRHRRRSAPRGRAVRGPHPRGAARLARSSGVVRIGEDEGKGVPVTVVSDEGTEETMILPTPARLDVVDGQEVKAGDPIVDGPRDPKELMEIKGVRETQLYLVEEVQKVYRDQGVSIHDKHIELIVRQMTRRIGVQEPGDTDFLPGERVDQKVFREMNKTMVEAGGVPPRAVPS